MSHAQKRRDHRPRRGETVLLTVSAYTVAAVERAVDAINEELQGRGFPFAEVKPRVQRDGAKHEIALVLDVVEGQRA